MLKDLADGLRRLANRLDPPLTQGYEPVEMPGGFTLDSDDLAKSEDAMSILDGDCLGYMLVRVVDATQVAEVRLTGHVPEQFWPGVSATLLNVARAAARR